MPHICPRPCSRLATAAVFISVGVVQFVVGIILLRSKYVYLLAGPDFWTSSCNISVGCLLGLSASVWKQSKKRETKRNVFRRNVLLSLLFSALVLNATTLGILLMGKGNTLLSIRLENGGKYEQSTFASEVLAYAYVTSVCSPIVCIVISIVSIAGSCFKYASTNKVTDTKTPVNSMGNNRPLRWIYTPELLDLPKRKIHELVKSTFSSSESSSEDETDASMYTKPADSTDEDVQVVLNHMAHGKRDTMLNDSAIMLRQMDERRKNKYNSFSRDGSYVGPVFPRAKERKHSKDYTARYDDSSQRNQKYRRGFPEISASTRITPEEMVKRIHHSKGKQLSAVYKNPYTSEELLNEYQSTSSKLAKHYPSQYKKFRERARTGSFSEVAGPSLSCTSDVTDYALKNYPNYKTSGKMSEIDPKGKSKSTELLRQKPNPQLFTRREAIGENEYESYESAKETSPGSNNCFSPDVSEYEEDSAISFARTSSWASAVVPISAKQSSVPRQSNKLIPIVSPVVPQRQEGPPKQSDDSGVGSIESNSFAEGPEQTDLKERKNNLSTFQDDSKFGIKEKTHYTKMSQQSMKKYDLNKVATMASISEEPNLELIPHEEESCSQDEVVRKMIKGHCRKKSQSQSETCLTCDQNGDDDDCRRKDITPKRKSTLKKMWSLAMSENQSDVFLDQVVDDDCLIGLSEEELIARQLRTRSIRKVIEQRIKGEMAS